MEWCVETEWRSPLHSLVLMPPKKQIVSSALWQIITVQKRTKKKKNEAKFPEKQHKTKHPKPNKTQPTNNKKWPRNALWHLLNIICKSSISEWKHWIYIKTISEALALLNKRETPWKEKKISNGLVSSSHPLMLVPISPIWYTIQFIANATAHVLGFLVWVW